MNYKNTEQSPYLESYCLQSISENTGTYYLQSGNAYKITVI